MVMGPILFMKMKLPLKKLSNNCSFSGKTNFKIPFYKRKEDTRTIEKCQCIIFLRMVVLHQGVLWFSLHQILFIMDQVGLEDLNKQLINEDLQSLQEYKISTVSILDLVVDNTVTHRTHKHHLCLNHQLHWNNKKNVKIQNKMILSNQIKMRLRMKSKQKLDRKDHFKKLNDKPNRKQTVQIKVVRKDKN